MINNWFGFFQLSVDPGVVGIVPKSECKYITLFLFTQILTTLFTSFCNWPKNNRRQPGYTMDLNGPEPDHCVMPAPAEMGNAEFKFICGILSSLSCLRGALS